MSLRVAALSTSSQDSYDPRNDDTIFRPDGTIVFPRSDGDASYGPPNVTVPPASARDVNYFHVFSPDSDRYKKWCLAIGLDLAEWAGRGQKAPNGSNWRLLKFPELYDFTEQRKGPKDKIRTDPYLFGSTGRRFRSTKEFLHHAQWLLFDRTMDQSNCQCKYCSGSKVAIRTSEGAYRQAAGIAGGLPHYRSSGASGLSSRGIASRRSRVAPENTVRVKTATLPPPERRPRLGVTVPSVPLRDAELLRSARAGKGHCEGYRIGEIVWVVLDKPVVDPSAPARVIDKWPAQIEDVKLKSHITATPALRTVTADPRRAHLTPSNQQLGTDGVPSSDQRVSKVRSYDIILFGAPQDKSSVSESRLQPFLAGFIDKEVRYASFGSQEDHLWMDSETGFPPKLDLLAAPAEGASQTQMPFATIVACLAFSMTACNYIRCRYRLTDRFVIPETASAAPARRQTLRTEPSAQASGSIEEANTDGEIRPGLGDRRRLSRGSPVNSETRSAATTLLKAGTFYQGAFIGPERIWVGDLVRLKLTPREVEAVFTALAGAKRLSRKSDADGGYDKEGSYVMRVRALVEDDTGFHAAGQIFQVMTQAAFDQKRQQERAIYEARAQRAEASGDPFGGMGRIFAFPAFNILTAQDQELPEVGGMAEGFVLSPICGESHEVIVDMLNIAGRLWPSLCTGPADAAHVANLRSRHLIETPRDLDTDNGEYARLALSGALPGWVKPLQMEDVERGSGEDLTRRCLDVARTEIREVVRRTIAQVKGEVVSDGELDDDMSLAQASASRNTGAASAGTQMPNATAAIASRPDSNPNGSPDNSKQRVANGDSRPAAAKGSVPSKRRLIDPTGARPELSPSSMPAVHKPRTEPPTADTSRPAVNEYVTHEAPTAMSVPSQEPPPPQHEGGQTSQTPRTNGSSISSADDLRPLPPDGSRKSREMGMGHTMRIPRLAQPVGPSPSNDHLRPPQIALYFTHKSRCTQPINIPFSSLQGHRKWAFVISGRLVFTAFTESL